MRSCVDPPSRWGKGHLSSTRRARQLLTKTGTQRLYVPWSSHWDLSATLHVWFDLKFRCRATMTSMAGLSFSRYSEIPFSADPIPGVSACYRLLPRPLVSVLPICIPLPSHLFDPLAVAACRGFKTSQHWPKDRYRRESNRKVVQTAASVTHLKSSNPEL